MDPASFFSTYYIQPLCSATGGYNIFNTLTYGLLTALVAFGIYYVLKFLKVKIDKYFFWGAAPYVILGSLWHVYEDSVAQCIPYFETPIIYLLFLGIGAVALVIGLFTQKKLRVPYWKFMLATAIIATIISAVFFFKIVNPFAFLKIIFITFFFGAGFYALSKKWDKLFTPINIWVLTAAMFDAASTAVGMSQYGYIEKHILPTFLINFVGTAWIMIPLKLVVVLFALYLIDKLEDDTQFNNIVMFAILCVTLGPGTRNTLRILMGV